MAGLLQDLRLAVRTVAKAPGYAFVVVLTLALAVAANTVIFSFADVLLLRPLPIRNATHLGWVFGIEPQRGTERARFSRHPYMDLRERAQSFSDLAAVVSRPLRPIIRTSAPSSDRSWSPSRAAARHPRL